MTTDLEVPADAAEHARSALREQVGDAAIGELLDSATEDDHVTTYSFACRERGYPGWRWAVTIVALPEQPPTVDELVLLPGTDSITAPAWVPWRERIRPGDLSPGDLLPVEEDDPRLVPAYFAGDEEFPLDRTSARELAQDLGLGRARVLSVDGRAEAAQRWYDGDRGPSSALAQSAPGRCVGCGFLLRLSGPLALSFGVCANAFANDDGQVVSFDHGCGAHSEAQLRKKQLPVPPPDPVFDSISRDDLEEF